MSKQDEHDDELVTRTAAMVLHGLKPALKSALLDLWRDFRIYLRDWALHSWWVRVTAGLLTLLALLGHYLKGHE